MICICIYIYFFSFWHSGIVPLNSLCNYYGHFFLLSLGKSKGR